MMIDCDGGMPDSTQSKDGIAWTRDLALGIVLIDHQHRDIVAILDRLHRAAVAATWDVIGGLLSDLVDRMQDHCLHEEQFMRGRRYPAIQRHIAEHNEIFDRLQVVCDDYEKRELNLAPHAVLVFWIWFRDHIRTADRDLKLWTGP